jgi:N-acetyl-alpha-D-muramate 1-phosphate uridylyltransferase
MIKRAMVLAAGFGKRIHPLTLKKPKPLLKIGKETLLSNTLKFLKLYGVEKVIINVHHLESQIIDYISKNKFQLDIKIIKEKNKILDTGGGVLNAIHLFDKENFLIINPDTIWNSRYVNEIKLMEKNFLKSEKNRCSLLVVDKKKSFDKLMGGDFSLKKKILSRKKEGNLDYIYTGAQIIKPNIFDGIDKKIFSINEVWNKLILNNELYGQESHVNFLHVSTLEIYKSLVNKEIKF